MSWAFAVLSEWPRACGACTDEVFAAASSPANGAAPIRLSKDALCVLQSGPIGQRAAGIGRSTAQRRFGTSEAID